MSWTGVSLMVVSRHPSPFTPLALPYRFPTSARTVASNAHSQGTVESNTLVRRVQHPRSSSPTPLLSDRRVHGSSLGDRRVQHHSSQAVASSNYTGVEEPRPKSLDQRSSTRKLTRPVETVVTVQHQVKDQSNNSSPKGPSCPHFSLPVHIPRKYVHTYIRHSVGHSALSPVFVVAHRLTSRAGFQSQWR